MPPLMTPDALLNNAIRPALQTIGLHSAAAEQLVLGTAIQESRITYRRQLGGGPARGLFQMEPATHNDIWENFLKYKKDLAGKVEGLLTSRTADKVSELENNDKYAAAMARVHYYRAPSALPKADDIAAQAAYWKQHYNTPLGKGTTQEYIRNWNDMHQIRNSPAPTTSVTWPLQRNVIRKRKESNTFGMVRRYADGRPKPHQGWDFEAKPGTPAYAIADGKVQFVTGDEGDYGRQVCISFAFEGQTYYSFYAHMKSISVKSGQSVKKNEQIGLTGKTGNASNLAADEDHLHFEIRTQVYCGLGLSGRVSPIKVYKVCPLNTVIMSEEL